MTHQAWAETMTKTSPSPEAPKIKEAAPFETELPLCRQKSSQMSAVPGLGDTGGNTS